MRNLTDCPNCSAVWGFDEIQDQECDACGYPNKNNDGLDIDYSLLEPDKDYHETNLTEQ